MGGGDRMGSSAKVKSAKILVVDGDHVYRLSLMKELAKSGYEVHGASGYREAIDTAQEVLPSHLITELSFLGAPSGNEVLRDLRFLHQQLWAIVVTNRGSIASALRVAELGAMGQLSKPSDIDTILTALGLVAEGSVKFENQVFCPTLRRVKWEHVQRVVSDNGGNVSKAARILGIQRRVLQRILKYEPPPPFCQ